MRASLFASVALALAAFAGHVEAHHAFSAAYDSNKPFTVTGTVTSVDWVNPHVHINVDSKAEDGAVTSWKFEVGSPNGLMRSGWTRNSLKPGDPVTVEGFHDLRVLWTGRDVQAGEIFRLYRPAVRVIFGYSRFLRQITLVIEHNREERQIVLLHRTVDRRHRIVVERAVADDAHHRPFRVRRLYAERS